MNGKKRRYYSNYYNTARTMKSIFLREQIQKKAERKKIK